MMTYSANFEELPPERRKILRSGNGWQVPCHRLSNSSLDSALKDRDCAELPVHKFALNFAEHRSLEEKTNSNELARVKTKARREKSTRIYEFISRVWYKVFTQF